MTRTLNVRLLVVTLATVAAVSCLAGLWYLHRASQLAGVFLQRATALEQKERWSEAEAYFRRYLQFEPDDLDARVRLVEAVEHLATTPQRRRNLVALLSETIGLMHHRTDLRVKLAQNLLEIGRFAEACDEAEELLSAGQGQPTSVTADQSATLLRIKALSISARARRGGVVTITDAADSLRAALKSNPADSQLASLLAWLYRTEPQDVGIADAATEADVVMDRLVAANPNNADSLVARYLYRRRFGVADARRDLDAALAQDPNHIDSLLLAANEDSSSESSTVRAAAEDRLILAISLAPNDPRGHIGLARWYAATGERNRAVEVLTRARQQLDTASFEIDGLFAGLLIDLNRLEEADQVLVDVEQKFRERLPQLTSIARLRQDNFNRLLKARLCWARNDLGQAVRELHGVVATAQQTTSPAEDSVESLHAYAMLATIMTKLQRLDLAAEYWKTVADQAAIVLANGGMADQVKDFRDARWKAGATYLELGRPNEAIQQIEDYLQSPSASPDAWITLVDGHLRKAARLPAERRNWSEFLAVLEQAKSQRPNSWELLLFDALQTAALGSAESKQFAVEKVRRIEQGFPEESSLLGRLVLVYQQLGEDSDATRALTRYEELETNVVRRESLRATLLARNGHTDDALNELTKAISAAAPEEQLALQVERVGLLLAMNDIGEASEQLDKLMDANPNEPRLLKMALDIALLQENFDKAQQWEDALKAQSAIDDFDWRFCRARRLIGQYAGLDPAARSELERLIESLRSARPSWYPIVALVGQHAELAGNRSGAIDAYQSAVELGDAKPATLERLVRALYAEGRYRDADMYLTRLAPDQPAYGRLESMAIATAVKGNRVAEALDMAKKAVARGSDDPMHHVWLASLLLLDGQRDAAQQAFRESVRRYPQDPRVWNGLFNYLVRTQQMEEARRVLVECSEKVANDEFGRHFVLAQGYEMLGEPAMAKQEYLAAIERNAGSTSARLRLARLLLSTDPVAARTQYEEILKVDSTNTEARRSVAALLAASGKNEDWTRATQMLDTNRETDSSGAADDERLRAILLGRRGRNRDEKLRNLELAKRILANPSDDGSGQPLDIDNILLAGIYEREAVLREKPALLQSARDAWRPLVDRENPPTNYLTLYIEFLLRHLEQKNSFVADGSKVDEQRELFVNDARLRIDELEASLKGSQPSDSQFMPIAYRARLMSIENRGEEVRQLLEEFAATQEQAVTDDTGRAKLYLRLGNLYSTIGDHLTAETWYRRLTALAPNAYILLARSLLQQNRADEAVDICLHSSGQKPSAEAAAAMSQLISTTKVSSERHQRVQQVISSALEAHGDNVDLLLSVAVQNVTEGNQTDAIRLFRRVIDINPNHALALNNLATLLADRPNELKEAREYVERAMTVAGRDAALLDTLGTIFIRAGDYGQAVTALEEAVAEAPSDPRYYFHLAVAYNRSGRASPAIEALETSHQHGLERAILTSGDRELLASLEHDLHGAPSALQD